jgi:elongation factor Ts
MSNNLIIELRKITGAGIVDCKNALKNSNNDIEKACKWLRENNVIVSVKKSTRSTKSGIIYSYIHNGDTLGVLVEINCETDFVAKTDEFKFLAKEISMQIAALSPIYVSRDQIPNSVIESEKSVYELQLVKSNKPKNIIDKIICGKIEKFYNQVCLYDQIYIRDLNGNITIKELISNTIAKLNENIIVNRFVRFKIGEK